MSKALIPGSFDPITIGHLDIILRASKLFDEVTVLVSNNYSKNYMLSSNERVQLVYDAIKSIENVKVDSYDGYLVDYVHEHSIDVIVKGLRNATDYQYEDNMAKTNSVLSKSMYNQAFETIFFPCQKEYVDISSSLVRILLEKNASVKNLVPNERLLKSLIEK